MRSNQRLLLFVSGGNYEAQKQNLSKICASVAKESCIASPVHRRSGRGKHEVAFKNRIYLKSVHLWLKIRALLRLFTVARVVANMKSLLKTESDKNPCICGYKSSSIASPVRSCSGRGKYFP
jgi:hypothetical protein